MFESKPHSYLRSLGFTLVFSACVFIPLLSAAAAEPELTPRCTVIVRSLKGSVPAEADAGKELQTGEFLADLKDQLEALPFSNFESLSDERQQIPLHEKAIFRVITAKGEQNTVFVETECISEESTTLKIDWKSESGAEILSTQLRLADGKNWVVGTDHDDESATIVSLKLYCRAENTAPSQ